MLKVTLAVLAATGVITDAVAIRLAEELGSKPAPDTIERMIDEIRTHIILQGMKKPITTNGKF